MKKLYIIELFVALCLANFDGINDYSDQPYSSSFESTGLNHFEEFGHETDFDKNIITGSIDMTAKLRQMSRIQLKSQFINLIDKMDLSKDGYIDKFELKSWISNSLKKLDKENSSPQMAQMDTNGDNHVSFEEYIVKHYGYTEEEIKLLEKDTSPDSSNFIKTMNSEREKFKNADIDEDDRLNVDEFATFLHPHNYPHMAAFEMHHTMLDFDRDGDGFVSEEEFISPDTKDKEIIEIERQSFKEYDINKDGKLDRNEMQAYIMPGIEVTANQEMEHLFAETDLNKDMLLSEEEILKQQEKWYGSQATNYGDHIIKPIHDEL